MKRQALHPMIMHMTLEICAQGLFLSRLPYTYVGWSLRYHTHDSALYQVF